MVYCGDNCFREGVKLVDGDMEEVGMRGGRPADLGGNTSLPRWLYHLCRHKFVVTGIDTFAERFAPELACSGTFVVWLLGIASLNSINFCVFRFESWILVMPREVTKCTYGTPTCKTILDLLSYIRNLVTKF
jgi:hypothetical protein